MLITKLTINLKLIVITTTRVTIKTIVMVFNSLHHRRLYLQLDHE
jgi:hypothetical protein